MRWIIAVLISCQAFATTYYVRKSGNNGSAGTSPSTAWLTVGHALTTVSAGDTIYVGAGTYRESNLTISTANTSLLGDPLGTFAYDRGLVIITSYTTNDTSAPASTTTLTIGNVANVTVDNLYIIGGQTFPSALSLGANQTSMTGLIVRRTILFGSTFSGETVRGEFSTGGYNILFDRDIFLGGVPCMRWYVDTSSSADFNVGITVQNSIWLGSSADLIEVVPQGANAFSGGGVTVYNSSFLQNEDASGINNSLTLSSTYPFVSYNNYIQSINVDGVAEVAAATNQFTDDYNLISADVAFTNVTQGAHTLITPNLSPGANLGISIFFPAALRCAQFLSPMVGSKLSGYGNHTGGPSIDITGLVRPMTHSVGALETLTGCPAVSGF